jgi:predicted DNA-binding transcriptional regulator AlpA
MSKPKEIQPVEALLHPNDLMRSFGISRTTLDKWVKAGHFPAPIEIGMPRRQGWATRVAWLKSEVDAWILERAAARRTVAPPLAAFNGAEQLA